MLLKNKQGHIQITIEGHESKDGTPTGNVYVQIDGKMGNVIWQKIDPCFYTYELMYIAEFFKKLSMGRRPIHQYEVIRWVSVSSNKKEVEYDWESEWVRVPELRLVEPGIAFSYKTEERKICVIIILDSFMHPEGGDRPMFGFYGEIKFEFELTKEGLEEIATEWLQTVDKYCSDDCVKEWQKSKRRKK